MEKNKALKFLAGLSLLALLAWLIVYFVRNSED